MDTWILWVVGCSVAFWIGKSVGTHLATYRMIKALADNPEPFIAISKQLKQIDEASSLSEIDSAVSELDSNAIEIELEEINGFVYAYNKTTGQFLAQARDIEQAVRIASQRFPGQTFWHPELKQDSQTA